MAELMLKDIESIDKRILNGKKLAIKGRTPGAEEKVLMMNMELLKNACASLEQGGCAKTKEH